MISTENVKKKKLNYYSEIQNGRHQRLAAPHTDDGPYIYVPRRFLNMIDGFVLLRFRARAPE